MAIYTDNMSAATSVLLELNYRTTPVFDPLPLIPLPLGEGCHDEVGTGRGNDKIDSQECSWYIRWIFRVGSTVVELSDKSVHDQFYDNAISPPSITRHPPHRLRNDDADSYQHSAERLRGNNRLFR